MARNNKGKVAGSGTATVKRRAAFAKKGLEREQQQMSLEEGISKALRIEGNVKLVKHHLMTAWELPERGKLR